MKRLIMVLFFILVFSINLFAGPLTLAWDYSDPPPDLEGFKIYQSAQSGIYTSNDVVLIIPAGTLEGTIEVPDGTYFWVVTAFDLSGNESSYSNELTFTFDSNSPPPPNNLRKITIQITITF